MVLVMLVSSVAVVSAGNDKPYICHANNGQAGWVSNTPADAGKMHGHLDHQEGRDIIPPFEYEGQWYEQNWDAYGQSIYYNGCEVPVVVTEPPTEEPTVEPTVVPSETPTETPTETPDETPVVTPDVTPDVTPTETPVETPVETPTVVPTEEPTTEPTVVPTDVPVETPTVTIVPTEVPTEAPTEVVPVMVAICHYDADTFRWGEIVVNENELEAYFADGDYYAPCDVSTEPEAPTEVVPVDICHYDITTGTWNETTVGSDELRDHFGKHGDYMAPCVDGGVDNEPGKETPVNVATPTEAAPVDNTTPNVVPLENGSKSESSQVVTGLPDTGTGFAEGKTYAIVSILVGAIIGGIVTYRMTED